MSTLAHWCFRWRFAVVGGWIVALVALAALALGGGTAFTDAAELPDSESARAYALLAESGGQTAGTETGTIVWRTTGVAVDDAAVRRDVSAMLAEIKALPGVEAVISPYGKAGASQLSRDAATAYARVVLADGTDVSPITETALRRESATFDVEVGGQAFTEQPAASHGTEAVGIVAALVILLVMFRSGWAAALPIITGVAGVAASLLLVMVASHAVDLAATSLTMGALIGLGVGIDYALFIVNRHRKGLLAAQSVRGSLANALDTSGRAVVFAGITVVVALLGMFVVQLGILTGMAQAAAITVVFTVLAAVTLLPALLAMIGHRVLSRGQRTALAANARPVKPGPEAHWATPTGHAPRHTTHTTTPPRPDLAASQTGHAPLRTTTPTPPGLAASRAGRTPPHTALTTAPTRPDLAARQTGHVPQHPALVAGARPEAPAKPGLAARWAALIDRAPRRAALAAVLVIGLLAAPVTVMRVGDADASSDPVGSPGRAYHDLMAPAFGAGFDAALLLVARTPDEAAAAAFTGLVATLPAVPGVAAVSPAGRGVVTVVPQTSAQTEETADLVHRLRDEVIPAAEAGTGLRVYVGGAAATSIDMADALLGKLPLYLGLVAVLGFLLLAVAFRSVLVPLAGALSNLATILVGLGALTAIFQLGWGSELLGVGSGAPVMYLVPVLIVGVVFGLSMDYQVFLVSRMHEEWTHTGHHRRAVRVGVAETGQVIAAAATIMLCVFASFGFSGERIVAGIGIGLGIAVLVDAFVVRLTLIPALMRLTGRATWSYPRWAERVTPRLSIEGPAAEDFRPPLTVGATPARPAERMTT